MWFKFVQFHRAGNEKAKKSSSALMESDWGCTLKKINDVFNWLNWVDNFKTSINQNFIIFDFRPLSIATRVFLVIFIKIVNSNNFTEGHIFSLSFNEDKESDWIFILGCVSNNKTNGKLIKPNTNVTVDGFWFSCTESDKKLKYEQGKKNLISFCFNFCLLPKFIFRQNLVALWIHPLFYMLTKFIKMVYFKKSTNRQDFGYWDVFIRTKKETSTFCQSVTQLSLVSSGIIARKFHQTPVEFNTGRRWIRTWPLLHRAIEVEMRIYLKMWQIYWNTNLNRGQYLTLNIL